jgi:hypothetical protein
VEATKRDKEAQQIVSSQTKKPSLIPHPKPPNPTPPSTPLKIQKLTCVEMVELQHKGLFYSCDDKYFSRDKCKEQNLFMAISEDVSNKEAKVSPVEKLPEPTDLTLPFDPPKVKHVISLNSLIGFSASPNPQVNWLH